MKQYVLPFVLVLSTCLTGCYAPQNFDNQLQVSRTGQYQIDIDSDFINGGFLYFKAASEHDKKSISDNELKKIYGECEKEYNSIVLQDKNGSKNILSSKYLGECRVHATLRFAGNIIKEKKMGAFIGNSNTLDATGLDTGIRINYDPKLKDITIMEKVHGDQATIRTFPNFKYNGHLTVKTDSNVISNNANNKPYWGLIGSYKWDINDFSTQDPKIVITTGF